MTLDTDGCIQLEENVFVIDGISDSFRDSFGEKAAEVLSNLHTKYVPDRITIEGPGPDLLCVYRYSVDSEDLKMMVQKAPLYLGEYGTVDIAVWETEATAHDHAT